ncbi:Malto-oligosyltrehalose trehalohydrolase [Anatilimnocola aggregata]|uniref:Malto-oligosyltrehalose trehalohydrolase n=1 Tax=Anatilimnocola aggregata TaxID=2528021 RepID=A0A517YHR8_9BACT|nr:malto-oligosyltrehalose trehalohydrolase [Anatilimnocola aggregata]QDU29773.1 Malto-oligosyltrehalose trehalohydrolase [Anatilimnocola aggregata]
MPVERRLPIGAEVHESAGVHFRVWAPKHQQLQVLVRDTPQAFTLEAEGNGYFSGLVPGASDGTQYWYVVDGQKFPDPASRYQPEGPHGPSQVVDPTKFAWTDQQWLGCKLAGQVIYEMHIGTFTRAGNWAAAIEKLPYLVDTGITLLEVMPVSEFPGEFGWGYDGVSFFAPTHLYGQPDDFRRFVNEAHRLGMGVILDVVYNHFGPDGNYIGCYSADYFTKKYDNEWGDAINFDGPNSGPVREFMAKNAAYWVDEYHLDGLRLDATQQIFDDSPEHILTVIGQEVRAAAKGRSTIIVNENERQESRLVRSAAAGGCGLDGIWNDDFHHTARVATTGHSEAYFSDYKGSAQELVSAVKWGFLYQGQRYKWQKARRGDYSLDLAPPQFITFLQNHDQVANSANGLRLHHMTSSGAYKAITTLLLLAPNTPMLFQGQEFTSSAPFLFFADHKPELNTLIREGRLKFLAQFPSLATEEMRSILPAPGEVETFEKCILDWSEVETNRPMYDLHRDLLRLRREEPCFRLQDRNRFDGAVLSQDAFVLRFFGDNIDDRLLVINLGRDLQCDPAPEPLLAPPPDCEWEELWSSEDPKYGGLGTPPLETEDFNWRIPATAAVVLKPCRLQSPTAKH